MDQRALDEIHRFTASVEQPDLYAYLDIERDADKAAVTHALQVRRSWAQGQQANPKYRQEALWLIKNINLIKTALTSEATRYCKDLDQRDEQVKLETLSMFIKGTLADGELTVRGEEAIRSQGEILDLPESLVVRRIGEILAERDAEALSLSTAEPLLASTPTIDLSGITDLYEILDADPEGDLASLEAAYRRRYRWARQLRDTEQSSQVYAQIDEAWRVLKDPDRRAAYDQERASAGQSTDSAEAPDQLQAFLPPPPPTKGIALPMPSVEQHLERIESGAEETPPDSAPAIAMPMPVTERDAPPPPLIPEPGQTDEIDYLSAAIEEPSMSLEDSDEDTEVISIDHLDDEADVLGTMSFESLPLPPEQPTEGLTLLSSDPAPDSDSDDSGDGHDDGIDLDALMQSQGTPTLDEDFSGLDMGLDDLIKDQHSEAPPTGLQDFTADMSPFSEMREEPDVSIGDGLDLDSLLADNSPEPGPSLSAGQIFNEQAILKIDGPRVIRIRTGAHPFPVRVTVRNDGEGSMPGDVSSNVPWVQISPATLDPKRAHQVIEALVEPDGIPGNSGKAIITIDTHHGETRTVTIDALKHVVSPVMLFISALAIVGVVGIFAGLYLNGSIVNLETPDRTILAINVDPPAGEVFINDELVGNQGTLSLVDAFPIDETFQVRVELDGFEPYIRDILVAHGTQYRVEAVLKLRELVNFEPAPGAVEATLDSDALDLRIEQQQSHIDACFTRNLRFDEPFKAEITVNGIVTARGFIQGVDFGEANFRSPAVETCVTRQLRSMRLPLVAGDFARFSRSMGAEIRPVNVLNEEIAP